MLLYTATTTLRYTLQRWSAACAPDGGEVLIQCSCLLLALQLSPHARAVRLHGLHRKHRLCTAPGLQQASCSLGPNAWYARHVVAAVTNKRFEVRDLQGAMQVTVVKGVCA